MHKCIRIDIELPLECCLTKVMLLTFGRPRLEHGLLEEVANQGRPWDHACRWAVRNWLQPSLAQVVDTLCLRADFCQTMAARVIELTYCIYMNENVIVHCCCSFRKQLCDGTCSKDSFEFDCGYRDLFWTESLTWRVGGTIFLQQMLAF